jgi:diacylglycerol kinase (ATP)
MTARRRIRVVWNGAAGSKGGITTNRLDDSAVRAVMREHDLGQDLVASDSEDSARAAARAAVEAGFDVVVAAGGDGTTGTVASELIGSDTALGILPLGSVMNVARSLGIPRELDAAAAVIAEGQVRRVDVGEVDGQPFFEAGSVGMNAALFREANRFDDGDWSSVLRTIWVALRYRPARMALELDDRTVRTRALMISVANGPYTGMGMQVAPDARLDDGRFDVRVFRGFSKWELLRHLAGIAFGRYRYAPHVSTYRSTAVTVTSAHPLPARADARDLGTTPVTFGVRAAALAAIVPAPGATSAPGGPALARASDRESTGELAGRHA